MKNNIVIIGVGASVVTKAIAEQMGIDPINMTVLDPTTQSKEEIKETLQQSVEKDRGLVINAAPSLPTLDASVLKASCEPRTPFESIQNNHKRYKPKRR